MKKILLFLFLSSISYSQNLIINYKTIVVDEDSPFAEFSENELVINATSSVYYSTRLDTVFATTTGSMMSNRSDKKRDMYMFKDLSKKNVQSYRQFSKGLVIDSTYSIAWKIISEKKTILEYNCQGAIGVFRGRNYKVYFTSEIPIKEGPFKFDGLPGLILQVVSDDGVVNITATGIKKTDELVRNPFLERKHNKIMNWEEYVTVYNKQFKIFDSVPITVDENGYSGKTTIPKRFIEVVVE